MINLYYHNQASSLAEEACVCVCVCVCVWGGGGGGAEKWGV